MVIAIDPGDIRKKHASKMECLCKIHDGSEHEMGEGYWLAKAVAADIEHKKVIPLYLEAYSQEARDFKSENRATVQGDRHGWRAMGTRAFMRSTVEETGASSTTSFWKRGRRNALSSVL